MCKLKTMISLLLCAALLLGLVGCGTPAPDESAPTTAPVIEEPSAPPVSDQYTQAAEVLRNAQDLSVKLTTKKTITTDTDTFQWVSDQKLILTGIGTDAFAASVNEELEIDESYDEFTEYYEDGTLYVNIYDIARFQGSMSEADFLARFAPAVLLDESLYTDISAEQTGADTTLTFAAPSGPESWALPEGAEFLSAGGTAKITDGTLKKTTYTIDYIQGNTKVSMEVSAKTEFYDGDTLKSPMEPTVYKEVDAIDALRLYDTAIMYIYSAKTASSVISQTIVSQAASYTLTEQTDLHYSGTGAEHVSDIRYIATSIDSNAAVENLTQEEHFQDGVYTYSRDGSTPEPDSSVTPANMFDYVQEFYADNLPALPYINNVSMEEVGGLYYLEMELNEEWGQDMSEFVSYQIFQDEKFLNNYASAYSTTNASYYIALDPATNFPLASGTLYSGIHTIEGTDYVLAMETSQTYRLADSSTYKEVTGEFLPEEAPEVQATPLFYRVTGQNGQQMYLMGTIHVGDEKTAYLPDEIYTALNSADALAVEADVVAFEEDLETNTDLAAQVAAIYLNDGNQPTKDMLNAEVYSDAIKLLKASGNYNSGMELIMPCLWSSSIESFYLTLGGLQAEKGVDMRLLESAKAQNKEIREVESYLFQAELLADFSPELQALLLEQTLEYTAAEYCSEVQTLYDLWCAGDEAALRQSLEEDIPDLTAEEAALYEEYLDAMIIQRNKDMLDVATSYLESGDTVFFAVGLAHLLQENGLVDTLQDAGYTVERVIYS